MDLTIFKLEDYARLIDGDPGATEAFQYLTNLTEEQFHFLVEMVEASDDHDWR